MDRVRSIALSSGVTIFTGYLNYLDSQTIFHKKNSIESTMPCLTFRNKGQCAIENMEYLVSKVLTFCNIYRLNIFCDSV